MVTAFITNFSAYDVWKYYVDENDGGYTVCIANTAQLDDELKEFEDSMANVPIQKVNGVDVFDGYGTNQSCYCICCK